MYNTRSRMKVISTQITDVKKFRYSKLKTQKEDHSENLIYNENGLDFKKNIGKGDDYIEDDLKLKIKGKDDPDVEMVVNIVNNEMNENTGDVNCNESGKDLKIKIADGNGDNTETIIIETLGDFNYEDYLDFKRKNKKVDDIGDVDYDDDLDLKMNIVNENDNVDVNYDKDAVDVKMNIEKVNDNRDVNYYDNDLDSIYITDIVKSEPNIELKYISEIKKETVSIYNNEIGNLEVCRGCKKSFQKILRHLACTSWSNGINCRQFYTDKLFQELKQRCEKREIEKIKDRNSRYQKLLKCRMSEQGKEKLNQSQARYRRSEKGREKIKQLQAEYHEQYRMSEQAKEKNKQSQARYRASEKGREYMAKYFASKKGKEKLKQSQARYRMSEKGREKIKQLQAKYQKHRKVNCDESENHATYMLTEVDKNDSENSKDKENSMKDYKSEVPLADSDSHSDTEVIIVGNIDSRKLRSAKYRMSIESNNSVNKTDPKDVVSESDTEVMVVGNIDRDFSCKVANCLADFWFSSQLEKHMGIFHK